MNGNKEIKAIMCVFYLACTALPSGDSWKLWKKGERYAKIELGTFPSMATRMRQKDWPADRLHPRRHHLLWNHLSPNHPSHLMWVSDAAQPESPKNVCPHWSHRLHQVDPAQALTCYACLIETPACTSSHIAQQSILDFTGVRVHL